MIGSNRTPLRWPGQGEVWEKVSSRMSPGMGGCRHVNDVNVVIGQHVGQVRCCDATVLFSRPLQSLLVDVADGDECCLRSAVNGPAVMLAHPQANDGESSFSRHYECVPR